MRIGRIEILVGLYVFLVISSELFGAKTFPLFNIGSFTLNASVAIFILPFVYSLTDIVIEVRGKEYARGIVYVGIVTIVLLMAYATLATSLPPSTKFIGSEPAYDTIFQYSVRMSLASIFAFAIAELLDVVVFSKLREKMKTKSLWLRNNLSNFLGFFVDSIIFMIVAFYDPRNSFVQNSLFIISLSVPYWLLKCGMSILETPLVYAGVKWLRREDTVE